MLEEENTENQQNPSSNQKWAHSTCSQYDLSLALSDSSITAIEADIVMGNICLPIKKIYKFNYNYRVEPIMSHPPYFTSDLSTKDFLIRTKHTSKHLKLDFKSYKTLIATFNYLRDITKYDLYNFGRTIFFNADVLQGPGQRDKQPTINADVFIQTCFESTIKNIQRSYYYNKEGRKFIFSLGWRVDCRSSNGYTEGDVMKMKELVIRHQILENTGLVVFALNARILSKNIYAVDSYLHEVQKYISSSPSNYPTAPMQLLIWTAKGEPPISKSLYTHIKHHYDKCGMSYLVGYDCKVAKTSLSGFFYDGILMFVSIIWNLKNTCLSVLYQTNSYFYIPYINVKIHR